MSEKELPYQQRKRIEEISSLVRNWRLGEGLSQKQFAKLANLHANSIYNIEHQCVVNIITLLKCISAMNDTTLSEFFAGMR
jgi:transcriptional regulator with XRE-family HTH domain